MVVVEGEERNSRRWWWASLKGNALIKDREGVNGQIDRVTWKPAGYTPAALDWQQ